MNLPYDFAHVLERAAGPPQVGVLQRATAFAALAAPLLLAPSVADDTVLRAVGRRAAAAVWRQVVLDLVEFTPVRQTVLRFASCRYWLRRLAHEASIHDGSHPPAIDADDPIWPIWYWLAGAIRAEERGT